MFTTGFKFFFGLALALAGAAVISGYATGGGHVGPISLGWKGGVGDHVAYITLVGLSVVAGTVALIIVSFRDADPSAQAHYLGVESVEPTTPTSGTTWPVIGTFGVAVALLGLALNTVFFIVGLVMIVLATFEWAMHAWADRATGDPQLNAELRSRIMAPIEIPVKGFLIVAAVALATSRIFLNASKLGSVVWAGVIASVIFGIGILFAAKPKMNRNALAGLVLATGIAVLGGGILAAVDGEREFHLHGEDHGEEHHGEDHGEEHGEDHSEDEYGDEGGDDDA